MKLAPRFGTRFLMVCGLIFLTLNLSAQQWQALTPAGTPAEIAFIYYAQGRDFSHTLRGQQTIFSTEVVQMGSIILDRTGIVQTGAGTSLEIQLAPSGAVIKLSENTTLIYHGLDENGGFVDIGLLFGRMRLVSGEADPAGFHPIVVRSGGVSARILEGDMGIDYVLEPGAGMPLVPMFRVNAFRGRAEVYSHGAGGAAAFAETQVFTVEQGETLSLDVTPTHTFVERLSLSEEIIAYWRNNNFAGTPPLRMPNTTIASAPGPAVVEVIVPREVIVEVFVPVFEPAPAELQPQPQPRQMSVWGRRLLIGVGFGLIGAAVGVQGLVHHSPDFFPNEGFANNMHTLSYAPLVTGMLLTLMGAGRGLISPAR